MRVFQKGFNYSQDGPGNRMVIHLQGCNMHCPWCANPEGLTVLGTLLADEKWLDSSLCPKGAVEDRRLNRTVCEQCEERSCVRLHRSKGLRYSCEEIQPEKLIQEVLSGQMMYYDGGGVTFTGGECTLQFSELFMVLKELKKYGINTAIETNATHPELEQLFPYLDHLIMDCKLIESSRHREFMGISNQQILENIRRAARLHPSVLIRVPLIGGVNNGAEELEDLVTFFASLPQEHISFEILKYHEYGKQKWAECGLDYSMTEDARVTTEEVKKFSGKMKKAGLHVVTT